MIKKLILGLSLAASSMFAQNVVFETTQGNIEFKLYEDKAPLATQNFKELVKTGYYNGIIFHRIIKDFMIQGGDPSGTGRGGQSIWKKPFRDEVNNGLTFNRAGILAMANAGPGTNGSQFFITVKPTQWLNNNHTIFGEVVSGMDTVTKLENVPVRRGNNKPLEDQKILKAYVK